jgi:hypothetical protein
VVLGALRHVFCFCFRAEPSQTREYDAKTYSDHLCIKITATINAVRVGILVPALLVAVPNFGVLGGSNRGPDRQRMHKQHED